MGKAQIFLLIVSLGAVLSVGLASPLQAPDVSNSVTHSRQRRDLHVITRNLINELVANMQQSSAQAIQSFANFTIALGEEKQKFVEQLLQNIGSLQTLVDQAVQDAQAKAFNAAVAVYECVENERVNAEEIFNDTISQVTDCVTSRIEGFSGQLGELAQLSTDATEAADEALKSAQDCGNSGNFFAVGSCLAGVLIETQVASATIAGQVAILTTRLTLGVNSLPITLAVCASGRLTEAALNISTLLLDLGQCVVTGAASAVIAA